MPSNPLTAAPHRHLRSTEILDFSTPSIQQLIEERSWNELPVSLRVGAVHDFVRNEVEFGHNVDDDISASEVLADGCGAGATNIANPPVEWNGCDTEIQMTGVDSAAADPR